MQDVFGSDPGDTLGISKEGVLGGEKLGVLLSNGKDLGDLLVSPLNVFKSDVNAGCFLVNTENIWWGSRSIFTDRDDEEKRDLGLGLTHTWVEEIIAPDANMEIRYEKKSKQISVVWDLMRIKSGLCVVFKLRDDIHITGGQGTELDPYTIR